MINLTPNIIVAQGVDLPNLTDDIMQNFIKIYMGGTTTLNQGGWRQGFQNGLVNICSKEQYSQLKFLLLDPTYQPQQNNAADISNPEFTQKLDNQYQMINLADAIFFNILKQTKSPYVLPELAYICATEAQKMGRTIVRLPLDFNPPQYAYAKYMCMRNNIQTLGNPTVADIVNGFFLRNPVLNEKLRNPLG